LEWRVARRPRYIDGVALFEPLFAALEGTGARYVVVGGVATVLHGFARPTGDVDLAIDLAPAEAAKTVRVLTDLGLRPRAPVDPLAFADERTRRSWSEEKGMRVFSLWDPANPMREVDLFVENPIDFDELRSRSVRIELSTTAVRIASIPDLIALKRIAGRPQDLTDIEALEAIRERKEGEEG
jgi:hypothetical protein